MEGIPVFLLSTAVAQLSCTLVTSPGSRLWESECVCLCVCVCVHARMVGRQANNGFLFILESFRRGPMLLHVISIYIFFFMHFL